MSRGGAIINAANWQGALIIEGDRIGETVASPPAGIDILDAMGAFLAPAIVDLGVPNFALAEYKAPENYLVADCPMCKDKQPITTF